jgi:hypothetical protein
VARACSSACEVVEALVELAQRGGLEVDDLDGGVLTLGDGHQTRAFSQA